VIQIDEAGNTKVTTPYAAGFGLSNNALFLDGAKKSLKTSFIYPESPKSIIVVNQELSTKLFFTSSKFVLF
jgi:hypothetical protein